MDASSTVAAATAGLILVISWVAASLYLFSYEKRDNGSTEDTSHHYSWTFHVESLRFYGFINFLIMLTIGALITNYSGLDTIQEPTETVLFKLLEFNHACNWIDHNPARMIASILVVPLIQLPLMGYVIVWHCRLAKDVKTGKVPKWLLTVSRVFSPYNFIVMAELHLWFVNNPDDTYGFTGHYIPFLMFQVSICLLMMMNICYLISKRDLPWGIPSWLAWSYFSFYTALTIYSIVAVLYLLVGNQVVLASRSSTEKNTHRIISALWAASGMLGTLVLSGKERLNGDVVTLKLGDNMLFLKSSDDEVVIEPTEENNRGEKQEKQDAEA